MLKTFSLFFLLFTLSAAAEWPFFVFENGVRQPQLEAQVKMLKEGGFGRIGSARPTNVGKQLTVYDEAGIQLASLYVGSSISPERTIYPDDLRQAIKDLKGRDTLIELNIQGRMKEEEGDQVAVPMVQEIADLARASGLKVALYPHAGFYVDTLSDGLRIATKSGRDNVGVMFNLCHFLKVEPNSDLEETIRTAGDRLFQVSISGANEGGRSWNALIQPLDEGTFNQAKLLKILKGIGYTGPVGLQCYGIPGNKAENMKKSMAAWNDLMQKVGPE